MAIFNQSGHAKRESAASPAESALKKDSDSTSELSFASNAAPRAKDPAATGNPQRAPAQSAAESLIAADLTIEGKIEGAGHVRLAGRFKGDVHVQGDLTIEQGAKLTGGVRARKVTVAGELEGNIESASHLELLESGMLVGDVNAGKVVVAPGSRMRGQVEFGWEEQPTAAKSAANGHVHTNGKADHAKDNGKAESAALS